MFFLNLSLGEFLSLLGALSGLVTAFYLLDQAKQKKIVSTLRFWVSAPRPDEQRRRKRIREPWSLLLQLASLLLLLLAIAQLQWGGRGRPGRNHVIVLDTSSSMAARNGPSVVMELARARARQYLGTLPPHDLVMLIRADSLATPAVSFTDNRKLLRRAIDESRASYSALHLQPALDLGYRALQWSNTGEGDVVFIGGDRIARADDESAAVPSLRVLPLRTSPAGAAFENAGIRQVGVRPDPDTEGLWRASVSLRNDGGHSRTVVLHLRFAKTDFVPRTLTIGAGETRIAEYKFSTTGPGPLTVSLDPADDLPLDNQAQLELPRNGKLRVTVYTDRREAWRPLLEADTHLSATYQPKRQYRASPDADVMLLDGFVPDAAPAIPSLWVMPGREGSPVPIALSESNAVLNHWNADTALSTGLHSKEVRVASAEIFSPGARDISIASTDQGVLAVARPGAGDRPRLAEIGFDPLAGESRYDITTPLLFANLLNWLEPDAFKTTELTAAGVGSASVPLESEEAGQHFRVVDDRGFAVPFTVRSGMLQLYVDRPSVIHVISPQRERILSLTLPGVGEYRWTPPAHAPTTLPYASWMGPSSVDLWKWLAVLGALGLFADWWFFGRHGPLVRRAPSPERETAEQGKDLVHH